MAVSKDDAARALAEIGQARDRASKLRGYRYGAPYILMWGALWLVANTTISFNVRLGNLFWGGGVVLMIIASAIVGARQSRDLSRMSEDERGQYGRDGRKWALMAAITWAAPAALFAVLWPMDPIQFNASLFLIWMFAYMAIGVWVGQRLFWTGLAGALSVLTGYFLLREHYGVWTGLTGGGAMIAGGLWMRRA